ncbi:MAG: hypothetical protein PGN37_13540 [Mycobacterium kyogaense]|uniref:hypothetical protein n=1 Tax=Mycobacterium kyogaense TaxID=2212479 RepID=UPI002FF56B4C
MNPNRDWWESLPAERRDSLNRIAQGSILALDAYPWSNVELMAELNAWQELETDVLTAHIDWLTRTKHRFESRGIPWTTDQLLRRAHVWEHE